MLQIRLGGVFYTYGSGARMYSGVGEFSGEVLYPACENFGASAGKMRCRTLGGADSRRAGWGERRGGVMAQNLAFFLG